MSMIIIYGAVTGSIMSEPYMALDYVFRLCHSGPKYNGNPWLGVAASPPTPGVQT
jgi:hypothetical protein